MGKFRYRMIADRIMADIRSGKLQPGVNVPSSRELAVLYDVSQVTAVHALKFLEKRGVLQHKAGKNYSVARKTDSQHGGHRFLTMLFRHVSTAGPEYYGNRIISGVMLEAARSAVSTYFSASATHAIHTRMTDFSQVQTEALMLPEQNLGFIVDFHIPDKILEEIVFKTRLPAVVIGRESSVPGVYSVVLDPLLAYRFLLQTLKRLGYQSFICCENHAVNRSECLVQKQFFRELAENEEAVILNDFTAVPWMLQREKLQHAIQHFSGRKTAVIFPNDNSARTGAAWLDEWHISIPEQIGITGFYGTRIATEFAPRLCCLSVEPELLGRTAVRLLLSQNSEVPVHKIPMEFVFGETV